MSYNSKYKGSEVEELLDSIGNKVDKVDGKQLSTEDFTTLLKQKLDGLSNYDDTAIQESVSKLRTDLDTLVSGDTTTAIKTFNEVIAFLAGISDTEDLASIIASIEQQIAAKQDTITDLATIRAGASKGATAVQFSDLASVATSGSYNDLSNKPTIPSPVTSETVSGWGFTKNAGTVTGVKMNGTTKNPSSGVVDLGTVITEHQDISGKQDKIEVVNHGTSDTTFTLTPNVYHKWGEVSSLSLTFVMGEPNEYNEYMFEFVSGATATTLTLPDTVSWFTTPSIEANKVYQVSIVNNVGLIVGV